MNFVLLNKAMTDPKRILIWDLSFGSEHAARLAKDGNEVFYYTEFPDSSPRFSKYAIGLGMEGITKIKKFFNYIDKVDYIMFLDIGRGDLCNYLRNKGYKVYGAGQGERLEWDRAWAKKIQKKVGMNVQPYRVIKGVDSVLRYIDKNPGKFVKLNVFRGDQESFFAKDVDSTKILLNEFKSKIGPFEESFEFIVEDPIKDSVETGWDLFFNGKDFLKPYLWGYAMTRFCIEKYTDTLPPILAKIANQIKPVLQMMNYRGAISCEAHVDKTGKAFVTDWTCRYAFPLSYIYTESMLNYSDVLMAVAEGKDIRIKPKSKYAGYVEVRSPHLWEGWLKVTFPSKLKDKIKLRQPAKFDNDYYSIKTDDTVMCATVETGTVVDDIFDSMIDTAEKIDAYGSDANEASDSVERIKEVIKKGKKLGLDF